MTHPGIADLLRALTHAPRAQWDTVSRALGFVPERRRSEQPAPLPVSAAATGEKSSPVVVAVSDAAADRGESDLPPRPVTSIEPASRDTPQWLLVPSLPSPHSTDGSPRPAPGHEPLLPPKQTPALLATLCSTRQATGRVDVRRVVDDLARRRPLSRLPRLTRPTLAHGIRVLADAGEGLSPFLRDRQQIVADLERLLGAALVESGWFLDDPLGEMHPDRPPQPGVPVLLLTDLGIGGGPSRRRWPTLESLATFAHRMAAQGSATLALVPFPPERWPVGMDRRIEAVFWDRSTTVSDVCAAKRARGSTR